MAENINYNSSMNDSRELADDIVKIVRQSRDLTFRDMYNKFREQYDKFRKDWGNYKRKNDRRTN